MVCTQSKPAEIPQHMFVQILVQVGGDRKRRASRTTLRTPTPLVIRHCFLVYCARTWKISFPPYLQMSETQLANELLHGNLCGSQHFLFEHCTTLQSSSSRQCAPLVVSQRFAAALSIQFPKLSLVWIKRHHSGMATQPMRTRWNTKTKTVINRKWLLFLNYCGEWFSLPA